MWSINPRIYQHLFSFNSISGMKEKKINPISEAKKNQFEFQRKIYQFKSITNKKRAAKKKKDPKYQ